MHKTLWALVPAMLAGCATTPDKDPVQLRLNDLEERVTRMERSVANEVQVAQSVDEMQGNLRELRGRIEELEHTNDSLRKQQRDLFGDLERRLNAAGGGTAGAAAAGTAAGAAAGAATGAEGAAAGSNAPSPTEQAVYGQAFDALKAGSNSIVIQVTNLWVNRLIGDQQPYAVRKYTFTDFAPYKAESHLLPSGLLGPVKIIEATK